MTVRIPYRLWSPARKERYRRWNEIRRARLSPTQRAAQKLKLLIYRNSPHGKAVGAAYRKVYRQLPETKIARAVYSRTWRLKNERRQQREKRNLLELDLYALARLLPLR